MPSNTLSVSLGQPGDLLYIQRAGRIFDDATLPRTGWTASVGAAQAGVNPVTNSPPPLRIVSYYLYEKPLLMPRGHAPASWTVR